MISHPVGGTELGVAVTLWRRRQLGDGVPKTINGLHALLRTELGEKAPSVSGIKKAVARLLNRERPLLVSHVVPRDVGRTGPAPKGYSLNAATMVTWASTASMLLELLHYPPYDWVDLDRFLGAVAAHRIYHPETKAVLTSHDLEEQLVQCEKIGYVELARDQRRVRVTQRLHDERLLLERIAERKKTTSGRETDAVAARRKSGTS